MLISALPAVSMAGFLFARSSVFAKNFKKLVDKAKSTWHSCYT
jgi:hypothetical protein